MAYKTPIIMTKVPSMKKLMKLEEGKDRRYAIPIDEINSPQSIKKAILEAADLDKSSLEGMVRRAEDFYNESLTPEKIAENYEKEYDALIKNRKSLSKVSHAYLIPLNNTKGLDKTLNSILSLGEKDSRIILSSYEGHTLPEELREKFKKEIAEGKITVLDSDKRITRHKSSALNRGVVESTKTGTDYFSVILSGEIIKDPHTERISEFDKDTFILYDKYHAHEDLNKELKQRNPIHQSGTIYNKAIFDKIGGFYDSLNYAEDMDFYQKILNNKISNNPIKRSEKSLEIKLR